MSFLHGKQLDQKIIFNSLEHEYVLLRRLGERGGGTRGRGGGGGGLGVATLKGMTVFQREQIFIHISCVEYGEWICLHGGASLPLYFCLPFQ